MITTVIVGASLALAVAFTLAWLLKPRFRAQVEAPKYLFRDHARQYDQLLEDSPQGPGGEPDEAR